MASRIGFNREISPHPMLDNMERLDTVYIDDREQRDLLAVRRMRATRWFATFIALVASFALVMELGIWFLEFAVAHLIKMPRPSADLMMFVIVLVTAIVMVVCIYLQKRMRRGAIEVASKMSAVQSIFNVTKEHGDVVETDESARCIYHLCSNVNEVVDVTAESDVKRYSLSWTTGLGDHNIVLWLK